MNEKIEDMVDVLVIGVLLRSHPINVIRARAQTVFLER